MDLRQRYDVVVVGGGMAGLSTAIWARRLGLSVIVLEQQRTLGGQLFLFPHAISDYPGLAAVTGGDLADKIARQAAEAGAVLMPAVQVLRVDSAAHRCHTAAGLFEGQTLVMATGLSPRQLQLPGESELLGAGRLRRPSQDPAFFQSKTVAISGGGDRAAENALLLQTVASRVHLIHRGEGLRARPALVAQLREAPVVHLHLGTNILALQPAGNQINLLLQRSGSEQQLVVDELCVYIGNEPNVTFVADQLTLTPDRYIETDGHGQTNLGGVFAVGDVCTPTQYQSLVTAAGQAMVVAKQIALHLQHP